VTSYDPLAGIQAAVNHPNADERVTLYEAVEMVTATAAWSSFEEKDKGTIEAGKLADLVILENDPFVVDAGKISGIKIEEVFLGGQPHKRQAEFTVSNLKIPLPSLRRMPESGSFLIPYAFMNTSFIPRYRRCLPALIALMLMASLCSPALAEDCRDLSFEHKPSEYFGSGEYFMICPGDGIRIHCYHYHRHRVCEKGKTLYWDRRLDSAARTACGCSLPADTAPASPATSTKPGTSIFGPSN